MHKLSLGFRPLAKWGVSRWLALMALLVPSVSVATTAPSVPTNVSASAGNGSATVNFTPGAIGSGTLVKYWAACGPDTTHLITATGSGSPITVTGLTNGSVYYCWALAESTVGYGQWSVNSTAVTPTAAVTTNQAFDLIASASGSTSSLTLDLLLKVASADIGTQGSIFLAVQWPLSATQKTWYFYDSANWINLTDSNIPAYYTGKLPSSINIPMLRSTDVRSLGGLVLYSAYGRDINDVLNKNQIKTYTIPITPGTSTGTYGPFDPKLFVDTFLMKSKSINIMGQTFLSLPMMALIYESNFAELLSRTASIIPLVAKTIPDGIAFDLSKVRYLPSGTSVNGGWSYTFANRVASSVSASMGMEMNFTNFHKDWDYVADGTLSGGLTANKQVTTMTLDGTLHSSTGDVAVKGNLQFIASDKCNGNPSGGSIDFISNSKREKISFTKKCDGTYDYATY
jgi:hypothetical protein